MRDRIIYSSFNHYSVANMLKADPTAKTGLLYMSGLYQPWEYARLVGATHIHPFLRNLLLPGLTEGCRENGVGINLWTVNDENTMRQCLTRNIGIITDYPDRAVLLRKEMP